MPTPVLDKQTTVKNKRKYHPKYKVILHNDDVNDFQHVMNSLQKVVGLDQQNAYNIMMIAHSSGKAVVIICEKEHAEHYRQGLLDQGLTATMEQE